MIAARLLVVLAFSTEFVVGQAPSALGPPNQSAALTAAFSVKTQASFPNVSNGYVVSHARTVTSGTQKAVFLTSLHGGAQEVFSFWLPSASSIRIEAGSVSLSGHVLLAGSYTASDGGLSKNFVSELDRNGKILNTFDLGDYTPERICVEDDGTFWTLGQVWPLENQQVRSYQLMRGYTASGTLLGQYFSRSVVPARSLSYHEKVAGSAGAMLRCGSSSVGALVSSAAYGMVPRFYWLEIDRASGMTYTWTAQPPPGVGTVTGLALLSEHSAYVTFSLSGLYILTPKSSSSANWIPVPGGGLGSISILLGTDGNSLVHLRGKQRPPENSTVYWTSVGH